MNLGQVGQRCRAASWVHGSRWQRGGVALPGSWPQGLTGASRRLSLALWAVANLLLILFAGDLVLAQNTNTPSNTRDFSSFKIVSDRNIFNANRSPRSARGGGNLRRPPQVDTFSLVGSLQYEKGPHAFFEGSSPAYKKVLKLHETIAGFVVADIRFDSVRLEKGSQKLELRMGMQMRREDEGEWQLSASSAATSSASSSGSAVATGASESSSSGDASEVLKRLMQQREQEMK